MTDQTHRTDGYPASWRPKARRRPTLTAQRRSGRAGDRRLSRRALRRTILRAGRTGPRTAQQQQPVSTGSSSRTAQTSHTDASDRISTRLLAAGHRDRGSGRPSPRSSPEHPGRRSPTEHPAGAGRPAHTIVRAATDGTLTAERLDELLVTAAISSRSRATRVSYGSVRADVHRGIPPGTTRRCLR